MSERSEPGPTTAPGVGTVSDELLRLRPDLDEYAGWRILLPRSYDVAMSQEGVEVLLAPPDQEGEEGPSKLPAVFLEHDELVAAMGAGSEVAGQSISGSTRSGLVRNSTGVTSRPESS